MRTIRYGSAEVPVLERDWPVVRADGYRKTYQLRPGQHWRDAAVTTNQFEFYVDDAAEPIPVGAAIARELLAEGATWACFTELWGRLVIVGADLVCRPNDGPPGRFIERLRVANGGKLGGLPDVVAEFPDGRVALREAKTPLSGDRLRVTQHRFADSARALLGPKLDLAVVEWGHQGAVRPKQQAGTIEVQEFVAFADGREH